MLEFHVWPGAVHAEVPRRARLRASAGATISSAYAALAPVLCGAAFLYAGAVVLGLGAPRLPPLPAAAAIATNLVLLALVALHHQFVQRADRSWRWLPRASGTVEQATDMLVAATLLLAACGAWQPLPAVIWSAQSAYLSTLLVALQGLGWGLVGYAGWSAARPKGRPLRPQLGTRGRLAMLASAGVGLTLVNWCVATMTGGHLLLAAAMTAYLPCCAWQEWRSYQRARRAACAPR